MHSSFDATRIAILALLYLFFVCLEVFCLTMFHLLLLHPLKFCPSLCRLGFCFTWFVFASSFPSFFRIFLPSWKRKADQCRDNPNLFDPLTRPLDSNTPLIRAIIQLGSSQCIYTVSHSKLNRKQSQVLNMLAEKWLFIELLSVDVHSDIGLIAKKNQ